MPTPTKNLATTPIPIQLLATELTEYIFPHLSMPRCGPQGKLGHHRVFNLIVWVLSPGMPWKCLPMPKDHDTNPAMHDITVYKVLARWADNGSLEHTCIASVGPLSEHNQPDLSVLHGDGTNTVAKKEGDGIGSSGHKHQKGKRWS